ncbi:AraC family transcriptional regulator [Bacillus kexueae]|uniref:AraC family transcriptional regulator n=1 Tax=Aeribacillus kexueae TaxID=2078952 RepID=UPI001FB01E9C|nr:helix-turn-helix domain-containing protein [Bacillus kexueae]
MSLVSFTVPPFPTFIKGGEAVFRKGTKHFRRTFSVFDLLYVKSGELYITEEEQAYTIQKGEYVLLVPGREHFGHRLCEVDTSIYWLHFLLHEEFEMVTKSGISWSSMVKEEGTFVKPTTYEFQIPQHGKMEQVAYFEHLFHNLVQLNEQQTPDASLHQQFFFQELLMLLQKEAMRIPTATERVCEAALRYIREHYKEEMKMEDLARELHFHPDYITRCVQKTIGISPIRYANKYRVSQAKHLLSTTNYRIKAIAKDVGIEDYAYFSKLFKSIEGISPDEYRKYVHRKA